MRPKKANFLLFLGAISSLGLVTGVAASCSASDSTRDVATAKPITVAFDSQNLQKITITGDTAHPVFTVPNELIYVDETNELSSEGTKTALEVFGRTKLQNLAGSGLTNGEFMPLELLGYYLSSKLEYATIAGERKLYVNNNNVRMDVESQYGGLFGFTEQNYMPNLSGKWDPNTFEVKYSLASGYAAASASELNKTVLLKANSLKTYFNVDSALFNDAFNDFFIYEPSSTHDNVRWTKRPAVNAMPETWTDVVASFKYTTEEKSTQLLSDLPNSYAFDASNRRLFVTLTSSRNFVLSKTKVDATEASKVQKILTKIDAYPQFLNNDLSTIELRTTTSSLSFNPFPSGKLVLSVASTIALPPDGAEIRYQIGSDPATYNGAELVASLNENQILINEKIKARIVPTDPTRFTIANPLESTIRNQFVSFVDTSAFFNDLTKFKVDSEASTLNNINFANQPQVPKELSDYVDRVEYLVGDYTTVDEANNASNWLPALPRKATSPNSKFFVRLVVKDASKHILTNMLGEVSSNLGIKKLLFDTDTSSLVTNLLSIRATGKSNVVTWQNAPSLDSLSELNIARVEYLVGDYPNKPAAASADNWFLTLPSKVDFDATKRYVWARIVPLPGYQVKDSYVDLTASSLVRLLPSVYQFDDTELERILGPFFEYDETSHHARVKWVKEFKYTDLPTDWKAVVASLKFATDLSGNSLLTTLPTEFDLNPARRRLYVIFEPKPGIELAQTTVDVTSIAKLGELRTALDFVPGYVNNDLRGINLVVKTPATPQAPFPSGQIALQMPSYLVVPEGAIIHYQIDDSVAVYSGAELIESLERMKPTAQVRIKARFDVIDSSKNVLFNDKQVVINNTVLGYANPSEFFLSSAALRVAPSSTLTQITFDSIPELTPELTNAVSAIEYLVSPEAVLATASDASGWQATLPTSVSQAGNHLYMRLVPKPGYILTTIITDLTVSSGFDKLLPAASALPLAQALTLLSATGLHNAVFWTNQVDVTPLADFKIASVEYLVGNYSTLDEAKKVTSWSAELPTTIAFDFTERHFYARFIPEAGYALGTSAYFDLTASSGIAAIKGLIDELPAYSALDLSSIVFSGSLVAPQIVATGVALPAQAKLLYQYGTDVPMIEADFKVWLMSQAGVSSFDLSLIKAMLAPIDDAHYAVTDDKSARPTTSSFQAVINEAAPHEMVLAFDNLHVSDNSVAQKISWEYIPPLFPSVQGYEYLIGEFPTISSAQAATTWSKNLPEAVNFDFNKRNFYVRALPKPGYAFTKSAILDLTATSRVQALRTDVTIEHSFLLDSLKTIAPYAGSLHRAVIWQTPNLSGFSAHFTVEYLSSTTAKNVADALTAPGYSPVLPSALAYAHESRYLYARINFKSGVQSTETQRIVDLTAMARQVSSDMSEAPGFAAMDLAKITISGGLVNAVVNLAPAQLISGVYPVFKMQGLSEFVSTATLSDYLQRNFATIQEQDLSTIQVKIQAANLTLFYLGDEKLSRPIVSDLRIAAGVLVPKNLRDQIQAIKVTPTSTARAVTWNPGLPQILPLITGASVLRLEVMSGNYPTVESALNAGQWKTFLPTETTVFTPRLRNLYVRVVPAPGYNFIDADKGILNLTASSDIQVPVQDVTAEHTNLLKTLEAIEPSATSTHRNVTWSVPSLLAFPPHILRYDFLSSTLATTVAEAEATIFGWSQTLPNNVDSVNEHRNLWVRINIMPGAITTNPIVYLNLSAKVQAIKTNVDLVPGFQYTDLSKVKITGGLIDAKIDDYPAQTLPSVEPVFRLSQRTPFMSKSDFELYLHQNYDKLTVADLETILVQMEVVDSSKYIVTDLQTVKPDITGLSVLAVRQLPTELESALTNLKVDLSSSTQNVRWSNSTFELGTDIVKLEFLSGNYSSPEDAATATAWSSALPTSVSFNAAERHLYVRITPRSGIAFQNLIFDLTTSSLVRNLLLDVTAEHKALVSALNLAAPTASSNHLNVTWANLVDLQTISNYFELEYLYSTTVSTVEQAEGETIGWGSELPSVLSYDHDSRHLFARIKLKLGVRTSSLGFVVDLSSKAQSVKTTLNNFITAVNANLSKIALTGYYVDAILDTSALNLLPAVSLRYDVTKLNGANNLTAQQLVTYLRDNMSRITLEVRDAIEAHLAVDETKFILSSDMRATINATKLQVFKPYDASPLVYKLRQIVLSSGSTVNNLKWTHDIVALPTQTAAVSYFVGALDQEIDVASLTDQQWSSALPKTLPEAVINASKQAHLWAKIVSTNGYVATPIFVDLTSSSSIQAARLLIPDAVVESLPATLRVTLSHALTNVNTEVHYTLSDLTALQSTYFKLQFLEGDFATQAAAEAATGWVDKAHYTAPTTLAFVGEKRPHVWVRAINQAGYQERVIYQDLTSVIYDVKADLTNVPNFATYNLAKLGIAFNSETSAPIIEEAEIGLPRLTGAGYEFSYAQNNGTDVWLSEADFIKEGASNPMLRTKTDVKVRLVSLDPSKYYLAESDNKQTVIKIAFRYDRLWTYKVNLVDAESNSTAIGNFMFFSNNATVEMKKNELSGFASQNTSINVFQLWGGMRTNNSSTIIDFVSTKFYDGFQTKFRGLKGGTGWASDISPKYSFISITGDYTQTTKKYRLVPESVDSTTFVVKFKLVL